HGPLAVLVPQAADHVAAQMADELVEGDDLTVGADDERETLVGVGERAVLGTDGAREPALVDTSALLAEREVVVRMKPETLAGRAEGAGHPGRREPDDTAARLHRPLDARRARGDALVRSRLAHRRRPLWAPRAPSPHAGEARLPVH